MRLKSFYAPTMKEAMRDVRRALGAEAIIVASHQEPNGGVRVTAALEDPAFLRPVAQVSAPGSRRTEEKATGDEVPEDLLTATHDLVTEALRRHRVPESLAARLVAALDGSEDPNAALSAALNRHLLFAPTPFPDADGKPLVLVGPPGAGKTLTLAKLATRATLEKKLVVLVTLDTERAGGVEQLAVFTRLLNVTLEVVDDAPALRETLALHRRKTPRALVLVDTAGQNPLVPEDVVRLRPFLEAAQGRVALALSADVDPETARDTARVFQAVGADRVLLTRTDLTRRLGGVLGCVDDLGLPLCAWTASPRVTEPPQTLDAGSLARRLLADLSDTIKKDVGKPGAF